MTLLPARFLLRIACTCQHRKKMPLSKGDDLLALPELCRISDFGEMDNQPQFADVRIAWNELGIGFQAEVKGKDKPIASNAQSPRSGDGVTLWIDTRDGRSGHRATRYCHQFHLLPGGSGAEQDEPTFSQVKIHRALQDAPLCTASAVPFRCHFLKTGYRLEVFLPTAVLNGYDPEQNRRLGLCFAVRDEELGLQALGVTSELPYAEDPSLWSVMELIEKASK